MGLKDQSQVFEALKKELSQKDKKVIGQEKAIKDLGERIDISSVELERARLKIDELQTQKSELHKSYFQSKNETNELGL